MKTYATSWPPKIKSCDKEPECDFQTLITTPTTEYAAEQIPTTENLWVCFLLICIQRLSNNIYLSVFFFFYTCIRRLSNNTYLSVFFVHLHKKTIEHHLFECPVLTNIRKLLLSHRQIKRTFHISNTTADVDACVLLHSIEPSCRSLGTARLITTKRLCLQTIVFLLQNIIVITVCKHINDLNMNLTYRLRKERTLLWRYMVSCCGESSSTPWLQTIRTLTAWLAIPSVYRYPGNTTLRLWLNGQR